MFCIGGGERGGGGILDPRIPTFCGSESSLLLVSPNYKFYLFKNNMGNFSSRWINVLIFLNFQFPVSLYDWEELQEAFISQSPIRESINQIEWRGNISNTIFCKIFSSFIRLIGSSSFCPVMSTVYCRTFLCRNPNATKVTYSDVP